MTANQFYKKHFKDNREHLLKVIEEAGTTLGNFQQIACHNGSIGAKLAKRLQQSSGNEMTVTELLFPDDQVA